MLKNKKKIIVGIVLIFGIITFLYAKEQNFFRKENSSYEYLVFNEEGEAFLKKVPEDFQIEVVEDYNFSYELVNSSNEKVKTTLKEKKNYSVIKPENKYVKGETYTLIIKNGIFKNEELKDKNKITFTIVRDEVLKYSYNDNVEHLKYEDVKITDNVITTNNKYEVDDIVIINDKEAYKITNIIDNNIYKVEIPNLNELFKDIDIYQDGPVNLRNFKVDEELEDYIVMIVQGSTWYEKLIEEVDAAATIKVETDLSKANKGILGFKIELLFKAQEEDKFIKGFDNHNVTFSIQFELDLDSVIDWSFEGLEAYFKMNSKYAFDIKLDYYKRDLDSLGAKNKEKIENFLKTHAEELVEEMKHDENKIIKELGNLIAPSFAPGTNFELELGLLFDFDFAVDAGYKLQNTDTLVFGINIKSVDDINVYGDYNTGEYEQDFYFGGEGKVKMGLEGSAGISVFNIAEGEVALGFGLYGEGKFEVARVLGTDEVKWEVSAEAGYFSEASLKLEYLEETKAELKLIELKKPFDNYTYSDSGSTEDEPVIGEVNVLNNEEIKAYYDLFKDETGEIFSVYLSHKNTLAGELTEREKVNMALRNIKKEDITFYDYENNVVIDEYRVSKFIFKKEVLDQIMTEMFGPNDDYNIENFTDIDILVQYDNSPIDGMASYGGYNKSTGNFEFQVAGIGGICGLSNCTVRDSEYVNGYQDGDELYLVERQIYIYHEFSDPFVHINATVYKDKDATKVIKTGIVDEDNTHDYSQYFSEGELVTIVLRLDSNGNYYFVKSFVE